MPMTTTDDVASRLGRPLTTDEEALASTLIGDVENMIRVRLPGRVLDGTTADEGSVKQVASAAVARVLRNPDGYRNEAAGGISYTLDSRVAAGFLTILSEEWALLGLSGAANGGAFSVAPVLGTAYASPRWSPWL
jgi:hypothetical protein